MRALWVAVLVVAAVGVGCASSQSAAAPSPPDFDRVRQTAIAAGLPDTVLVEYDSEPILQNSNEIEQALDRYYPLHLKDRGVGGRIETLLHLQLDGRVGDVRIARSSGNDELDEAAIQVVRQMEFSPALRSGAPVRVWVTMWVAFAVVF